MFIFKFFWVVFDNILCVLFWKLVNMNKNRNVGDF